MSLSYFANTASISSNSSLLKARFSNAFTLSSIWLTLLAPINTLVTFPSRRIQATAISANVWPRLCAISFSARDFSMVSCTRSAFKNGEEGSAGTRIFRNAMQIAIGQHALRQRAEGDGSQLVGRQNILQPILDPTVIHVVGRLVDDERRLQDL
jgi:hypothetical protein